MLDLIFETMRMSCNGCRVLRKGCGEDCSIRPCLTSIPSPDSQSNATLFLAKFYGRAGLLNLLNSGADHQRPAIFRSLLHEACGRIVNPIYGSVGLLWSGKWHLCQAAVEAVLKGEPIAPIESGSGQGPPLNAGDIRHVARDNKSATSKSRRRRRVKRSSSSAVKSSASGSDSEPDAGCCTDELKRCCESNSSEERNLDGESKDGESESVLSTETTVDEATAEVVRAEPESSAQNQKRPNIEVGLELTLGLGSVSRAGHVVPVKKRRYDCEEFGSDLGLDYLS